MISSFKKSKHIPEHGSRFVHLLCFGSCCVLAQIHTAMKRWMLNTHMFSVMFTVKCTFHHVWQEFHTNNDCLSLCFCKMKVVGDETDCDWPDAGNWICFIMGSTGKLSCASAPWWRPGLVDIILIYLGSSLIGRRSRGEGSHYSLLFWYLPSPDLRSALSAHLIDNSSLQRNDTETCSAC